MDFDLFVIGAGSGGIRAARTAASLGARVAIAEARFLGGTCVNVGCIPKKLLVYASRLRHEFADAAGFGFETDVPAFDWSALIGNKDTAIARLNGLYERMLGEAGVTVLRGRARLTDPHTVEISPPPQPSPVEGEGVNAARSYCASPRAGEGWGEGARATYTARHILIATGGHPVVPDFPGREHVITSDDAFFLERLPRRVLVVGGGYIAAEFAGIFSGLGAQTTLAYRGPLFLRGFDDEAREFLAAAMRRQGVALRFDTRVAAIAKSATGLRVSLHGGEVLETDLVLYATGRQPNTTGLGLEAVGVERTGGGAVIVDEHYQSSVPSIHALGDVINRLRLTPVAIAEARALAHHLLGGATATVDYAHIPTAVFCTPELAAVGLTETAARARGDIVVYRSTFKPTKHLLSGRDERSFMKLIVDKATDRLLGAHMVGEDAAEVIQGLAIAIKAGATKAQLDSVIGIHPTAAEEFFTLR